MANKHDTAAALNNRLKDYGSWEAKMDMDRFVILVFLTAAEKQAFAGKHLGDPLVDYFDGDDVQSITLKETARAQSA
jgi:hypothetical protein